MKPRFKKIIVATTVVVLLIVFGIWFMRNGSRSDFDNALSHVFGDIYCGIFVEVDDECIGRVDLSDINTSTINSLADGTTIISSSNSDSGNIAFNISENQANLVGPQGPIGATGPRGDIGLTGAVGPRGETGLTGLQGERGLMGIQGLRGIQGEIGLAGDDGTDGAQGVQGAQGSQGVQGAQGVAGVNGQSAGQLYWFQDVESDVTGYESFLRVPGGGMEQDESTIIANPNQEYLVDAYATEPNVPGVSQLPVGLWQFHTYTYVSGGSGNIVYRVYRRDLAGVETELFNTASADITSSSIAEVITGYTYSGSDAMESTDRLVVKIYAKNTVGGESTHFAHNGTEHVSYAMTSLGLSGIVGAQGEQGIQGIQGIQGTQGIQGIQGLKGDKGDTGEQGVQGPVGATGAQGVQGIQGPKGDKGDTGAQGIQGVQGLRGEEGEEGIQGPVGAAGAQGVQGIQGIQGATGLTGVQGVQGIQGVQGPVGAMGPQGPAGSYTAGNGVDITDDTISVKLNGTSLLNGASGLSVNLIGAKFGSDDVNFSQFETDGTLVFNGDATVWEDLRFPATAINPAGAANAMVFDTANIGFTAGAPGIQAIAILGQMPHAWKVGSDIYPHIHWQPTTTNTGNVLWRMEYKWTNINDTEPGSFTTVEILDAGDGTAFKHQLVGFGAISGIGKTLSSQLSIKISRVGDNVTDTYTGDTLLKEFDIHYEIDTLGSRTELTK
jgi:hypothetical protein